MELQPMVEGHMLAHVLHKTSYRLPNIEAGEGGNNRRWRIVEANMGLRRGIGRQGELSIEQAKLVGLLQPKVTYNEPKLSAIEENPNTGHKGVEKH